ncbi:hypothetical protein AAVH_26861 [Aphelenchoides avenae]|nr:hypothetical protein AAVH_26861 [Aphelenchus avenae]
MSVLPVVLAAFAAFVAPSAARCPSGSVQGLADHHCYVFGTTPATWIQAEEKCVTLKGHLASVSSVLTNAFLATYDVPCSTDHWLGGILGLYSPDAWSWSDGRKFSFANWAAGQPGNSQQPGCLYLNHQDGKWYSASCSVQKAYVCQVPEVAQPVTTTTESYDYNSGENCPPGSHTVGCIGK